jgi:hypothetical protein
MKLLKLKSTLLKSLSVLTILILGSCADDLIYDSDKGPEEGLPATVTFDVYMETMPTRQRTAMIDDDEAKTCDEIWIGIYRESDGKRVAQEFFKSPTKIANIDGVDASYQMKMSCTSGRVYVVGVSNYSTHYGFASPKDTDRAGKVLLTSLLDDADTWTKFRNIVTIDNEDGNVNLNSYDILMGGYYAADITKASSGTIPTVDIGPGVNDLSSGGVYLRRVLSYNKFNVTPGNNVNFELTSWKVFNVPGTSYVVEGTDNSTDHVADCANAFSDSQKFVEYHKTGTTYSFDFYQMENKRQALEAGVSSDGVSYGIKDGSTTEMYNQRELEYKNSDGTNTKVFRSLVPSSGDGNTANNYATYVLMEARVDYYILKSDLEANQATEALPVDPSQYDASLLVHRTGEVQYVVHLGYCDYKKGEDPTIDTARDFNCKRNTKYTYNITINGLKSIVVEVERPDDPEPEPGGSGLVTDIYGMSQRLDAHFCTYNISLSNKERASLQYTIESPFNGVTYRFNSSNYESSWENNQLYSWVKFKPTTEENVLAVYKDSEADNSQWTLHDLCDPVNHPHDAGSTDPEDETQQWYTVFVNEYVYTADPNGNSLMNGDTETGWENYVNQEDRVVALAPLADSKDQDSHYASAKYAIEQRSIQTYYASNGASGISALGVEHVNEIYGVNLRWNNNHGDENANSPWNGRANVLCYSVGKGLNWNQVVQATVPMHVDEDSNTDSRVQTSHEAADYPVCTPATVDAISGGYNNNCSGSDPAPKDQNKYFALMACMNRNRDENGNGKIDTEEVKWYLPAQYQYQRISMGVYSLPSPLMDFRQYARDAFSVPGSPRSSMGDDQFRAKCYAFHYATSDKIYFWSEELLSTGQSTFNLFVTNCYDVRCARDLGTDLKKTRDYSNLHNIASYTDEPFTKDGNYVTMSYFDKASIRAATVSYLPPHLTTSSMALPAYKFEVATDYCKNMNNPSSIGGKTVSINGDGYLRYGDWSNTYVTQAWANYDGGNQFCLQYSQKDDKSDLGTWRVPNLIEGVLMKQLGFVPSGGGMATCTFDYFYYCDNNVGECAKSRAFGVRANDGLVTCDALYNGYEGRDRVRVRCVRDVL